MYYYSTNTTECYSSTPKTLTCPTITGGSCLAAALIPARPYPTPPAANSPRKPASSLTTSDPLWDRETRFRYRGQEHHRRETVYLARVTDTAPTLRPRHTANEAAGLLGHHWWSASELAACTDKLLPPNLPALLADALADELLQPVFLQT